MPFQICGLPLGFRSTTFFFGRGPSAPAHGTGRELPGTRTGLDNVAGGVRGTGHGVGDVQAQAAAGRGLAVEDVHRDALGIGGAVIAATGGALYAVGAKKTKEWKGGTTLSAAPVLAPGFAGAAARLRF